MRRARSTASARQMMGLPPLVPPARKPVTIDELVQERRGETTDEANLNKTERRWLDILRSRGYAEPELGIQDITLKLADNTRYTPDFRVILSDNTTVFYEVKGGFIREDAWVKLKTAARQYRRYIFVKAQEIKGEWTETIIKP